MKETDGANEDKHRHDRKLGSRRSKRDGVFATMATSVSVIATPAHQLYHLALW